MKEWLMQVYNNIKHSHDEVTYQINTEEIENPPGIGLFQDLAEAVLGYHQYGLGSPVECFTIEVIERQASCRVAYQASLLGCLALPCQYVGG